MSPKVQSVGPQSVLEESVFYGEVANGARGASLSRRNRWPVRQLKVAESEKERERADKRRAQ